jgi:methylenetetrahydrofolate dehydrogenase (NADP+)/methenyltetrahydrofolate cyclohydrolase
VAAQILDGALVASKLNAETAARCADLTARGIRPGAGRRAGGRQPGVAYLCEQQGQNMYAAWAVFGSRDVAGRRRRRPNCWRWLPRSTPGRTFTASLSRCPLPAQVDAPAVIRAIDPEKDVDGFHPVNVGRLALKQEGFVPCTPAGVVALLDHYDLPLRGQRAVVLGAEHDCRTAAFDAAASPGRHRDAMPLTDKPTWRPWPGRQTFSSRPSGGRPSSRKPASVPARWSLTWASTR